MWTQIVPVVRPGRGQCPLGSFGSNASWALSARSPPGLKGPRGPGAGLAGVSPGAARRAPPCPRLFTKAGVLDFPHFPRLEDSVEGQPSDTSGLNSPLSKRRPSVDRRSEQVPQ